MHELRRVLYDIADFVLDAIGQVLAILVRLAQQGVNTYQHSNMGGKLLGVLLIFVAAWALMWFIQWVGHTAARFAVPILVVVLVVALILAIADPHPIVHTRRL